jgi:transcriptional adapter 3
MPRRGKRHYTEVWAEEDGAMSIDSTSHRRDHLPANQPRGSMDQMNDDVAETEQVSAGPLLSRLISAMAVEDRAPQSEDKVMTNGIGNGDINGVNGSVSGDPEENLEGEKSGPLPPATFVPDSTQPGWRVPTTKLDYAQVDERLKQELRHLGFITEDAEPDYDAHYDDEIAARLRILQDRLKEQCIINGARKARIAEVMNDRMAHQEYNTIREDLDQQVTQAYLKRNRTLGKSKKQQKRPGGAGGGSHFVAGPAGSVAGSSRPGIGDAVKTVMERRKRWIDNVGPVFDDVPERVPREGESIFDDSNISRLVQKERDNWEDGEE